MAPKQNKQKRKGRRPTGRRFIGAVDNALDSPWRRIKLPIDIKTTIAGWSTLKNGMVQGNLEDHLGFTPAGEGYLEVKYNSLIIVDREPLSKIAARLYKLSSIPDASPNVETSRQSYSTPLKNATISMRWSKTSASAPMTKSENNTIASIYTTEARENIYIVVHLTYRHAETPFQGRFLANVLPPLDSDQAEQEPQDATSHQDGALSTQV